MAVNVGALGLFWLTGRPRKAARPSEEPRTPDEQERRYKLLAADVEEALEKMERLNDRIRKRAKIDAAEAPAPDQRPNGRFLNGPAVLAYAKEKGLIK